MLSSAVQGEQSLSCGLYSRGGWGASVVQPDVSLYTVVFKAPTGMYETHGWPCLSGTGLGTGTHLRVLFVIHLFIYLI